jgi:DNA-binding NarL/FixJ family response regulator
MVIATPLPALRLDSDINATHVLLVEDDPDYSRLIERTLELSNSAPFLVDCVGRLDTALKRLEQREYDAMLLDLSLPDGRGSFTVGSACSLAGSLPVLVLTASDEESLVSTSMRAGAEEHLVKTRLDRRSLPDIILRAIDRHKWSSPALPLQHDTAVLFEEIDAAIAQQDPADGLVAVLIARFDNFELLRCLFGTEVCDQMHRNVDHLSNVGPIGRRIFTPIESGTFATVLHDIKNQDDLENASEQLLRSLADLQLHDEGGFEINGISASLGIAVQPWDGRSAEALVANAKNAQVCAARAGGSRFHFYQRN